MKLLNKSLIYTSSIFLAIIAVWSVVFYLDFIDEIRDSIDDGLDNNRLLIIEKAHQDSTLLMQNRFGGNNFKITPISKGTADEKTTVYKDTLMYRLNEDEHEPVRLLRSTFEQDGKNYQLTVISSLVEEDDLIEDMFWNMIWLFVALVLSVVIINNLILRRVWNPFYEILKRLKTFRIDSKDDLIQADTEIREFKELQLAANALIKHSRETFIAQKEFTENAAHELQTPLAISLNKLELLLESDELNADNAQSIAEVIQIIERLTRLNKSLLLLAKIENQQYTRTERISIPGLVEKYIADFSDFSEFKEVHVHTRSDIPLIVEMDGTLANILIANLVKNALFHNVNQGEVRIEYGNNHFRICNTGPGTALDRNQIFSRFQKTHQKSGSVGLGVSLCHAIARYYNFKISYKWADGMHCFEIEF